MKMVRKLVVSMAAALPALAGVFMAAPAHAQYIFVQGYVCTIFYDFMPTIYGDYGSVQVHLYTGPDCTTPYIQSVLYSSTGATKCKVRTNREQRLIAISQMMALAASEGLRVSMTATDEWPHCGVNFWVSARKP